METTQNRVLKANTVKLQGSCRLGLNGASTPKPAGLPQPQNSTVSVYIVEKNAECAVIEVVCCCGARTRIRCDYDNNPIINP